MVPRAVLEIPGSQRRLDRIFDLLCSCQYSVHDICRVELDRRPPPAPRFNMPFELGLSVAWSILRDQDHHWFVFEARHYRQQKSLSDLNGTEIYIHEGTPLGVLRELTNALAKSELRPTVKELRAIYTDLRKYSRRLKRELATTTLFETRPFQDLVIAAAAMARTRIAALRKLEYQARH